MSSKKHPLLLITLTLVGSLFPTILWSATVPILDTNFGALPNKTYSNGSSIGSAGGAIDTLTAQVAANTSVAIAEGTLALTRNTSNSGANTGSGVYKTITDGASYETLAASFTFSLASFGPTLRFHIDSNTGFPSNAGASSAAVSLWVNSSGNLRYLTDSGANANVPASEGEGDFVFSKNISYTISILVDFTSKTQDSWSFILTESDSGNVVFSSGSLKTRAANITPGVFAISTLDSTGGSSAFAHFSDISLTGTTTAIPEVSASVLFFGFVSVVVFLLLRRKTS